MDPVTLALALGLTSGVGGVVGGIADATSDRQAQQRNKSELTKLLAAEELGRLGLTGEERQSLDNQLNAPVAQAASQARARSEQLAASQQNSSGANLSRLRQEQSMTQAAGAQAAAAQIAGADMAKKQQQKAEIEQRLQAKAAYKRDDISKILGGLQQMAGPIGMLAGAPPGTAQAAGMFGTLYSAPEQATLQQAVQSDPVEFQRMMAEILKLAGQGAGSAASGGLPIGATGAF